MPPAANFWNWSRAACPQPGLAAAAEAFQLMASSFRSRIERPNSKKRSVAGKVIAVGCEPNPGLASRIHRREHLPAIDPLGAAPLFSFNWGKKPPFRRGGGRDGF